MDIWGKSCLNSRAVLAKALGSSQAYVFKARNGGQCGWNGEEERWASMETGRTGYTRPVLSLQGSVPSCDQKQPDQAGQQGARIHTGMSARCTGGEVGQTNQPC